MASRRQAHNTPIHMDLALGAFLKRTIQEIHVDRRVGGWSAGRHVDHPLNAPKSQRFLCDLRLRCPSRTPEIASDFQGFALEFKGVMERD